MKINEDKVVTGYLINMASNEEKELMVREFMELFGGRFTREGAKRIHEHVGWDKGQAADFVMKNKPSDVTKIATTSEDIISTLQTDPEVLYALENGIKSTVRQFACQPCDNVWWWRVPFRKQVSKCYRCKQKYDPVPTDKEWGWAIFDCSYCGNQFSSYGQMKVTICVCYQCGRQVKHPTSIVKTNKRSQRRRTGQTHSCLGRGCTHGDVPIHDDDSDRVYDADDNQMPHYPTTGMINNSSSYSRNRGLGGHGASFPCLSPESRINKKRVIHPSLPHKSTGSTVGTFLPQDDIASTYVPSLSSIREEHTLRKSRGRGRRGGK